MVPKKPHEVLRFWSSAFLDRSFHERGDVAKEARRLDETLMAHNRACLRAHHIGDKTENLRWYIQRRAGGSNAQNSVARSDPVNDANRKSRNVDEAFFARVYVASRAAAGDQQTFRSRAV